ncbi:MAG: 3-dehydroquinate synthase [Endomicrobium sp.]|jgi:3-dehydroquinate synthase|nr:3-dehydroquinate synthase [Endomicrobium sp.]
MKQIINVNLKTSKYDIVISQSNYDFLECLTKTTKAKTLFVITDKNVEKFHLKYLINILKQKKYKIKISVIPSGEIGKSIKNLSTLYSKAIKAGIDRCSCVIALGGGVVGDIAGFFAATYMRGIKYIQVPTTLLAMTDSSIGGKTGINTNDGKNIIGAFHQPSLVWINSLFLNTLPKKHIRNGFAEIIKYAFIFNVKFFNYLLKIIDKKNISSKDFNYIIYKSCFYKVKIVKKDEKEMIGLREILNFGHTFAHALETITKYKKFLHGEAVAIGMLFATRLSLALKICKTETYNKIKKILIKANFVLKINYDEKQLLKIMKRDKKTNNGNIKFILIKNIAETVTNYINDDVVLDTIKNFIKHG